MARAPTLPPHPTNSRSPPWPSLPRNRPSRRRTKRCLAATRRCRLTGKHFVNGSNIKQPAADGLEEAVFGLGCFWGAERKFWQIPGVVTTAVGYAGGYTPNATYEEVCTRPHRPHRSRARDLRP